MNRLFCFSTGNIWRLTEGKNRAGLIDKIKELDIDGVELIFGSKEGLYNFSLKSSQLSFLRKLDYVSIHAPFRLASNAAGQAEVIKQLDIIQIIYNRINAKNVIIHPNDLPPPEVLEAYNMQFSTENLPKKRSITIRKLGFILKKYPKMGLCLDVSHAYLWSSQETSKLVKKFSKKIMQVHFSGTYRKQDHLSLQKVTPVFLKSIEPIKKLGVPIIIEEDMNFKDDIDLGKIKKEVEYIKSLF